MPKFYVFKFLLAIYPIVSVSDARSSNPIEFVNCVIELVMTVEYSETHLA